MSDLADIRVKLVETSDEIMDLLRWLGERRPVLAVDLETTGLRWWDGKIRTAQVGDSLTGWTVDYARWAGVMEIVANEYKGDIVMHNGQFDRKWLEKDDIEIPSEIIHDTMLLAHAIAPDQGVGLKSLADKFIAPVSSHGQQMLKTFMKKTGTDWATVPIKEPSYWGYGGLDVVFTARIWEILNKANTGQTNDVYELERAVGNVLMRMTQKGFRVDMQYVDQQIEDLRKEIDTIAIDIESEFGVTSVGSTAQLAEVLEQDGWTPTKYTPSGRPKLDKDVLDTIDHPLVRMVLDHRKAQKLLKSYFLNFRELQHEGRIHCDIRQLGARTGRMSVSSPSLQNPPRGTAVRNAFIPSEGHTLCAIDFDQIEYRLMADLGSVDSLIKAFHEQPDMHRYSAAMVFGVDVDEVTDEQRQASKTITFAKLYGAGVPKIASQLGISTEEGQTVVDAYNDAFPEILAFTKILMSKGKRLAREFNTRPYTHTEMGRYQPTDNNTEYRLANYKIQGTAADILKQVIVDLDASGFGEYMLLPVHDEVVFEFPDGEAEDLMREAEQVMTRSERRVPLTVGGGLAKRWGEAK